MCHARRFRFFLHAGTGHASIAHALRHMVRRLFQTGQLSSTVRKTMIVTRQHFHAQLIAFVMDNLKYFDGLDSPIECLAAAQRI